MDTRVNSGCPVKRATSCNSSTTTGSAIYAFVPLFKDFAISFAINPPKLEACSPRGGLFKSFINASFTSYTPDSIGLTKPPLPTIALISLISKPAFFNSERMMSFRNWNCEATFSNLAISSAECLMFFTNFSVSSSKIAIFVDVEPGLIARILNDIVLIVIFNINNYSFSHVLRLQNL